MNEGRILTKGDLDALQAEYGHTTYRVYTTVELPNTVRKNGQFCREVESMAAVERTREEAIEAGGEVTDIRTEESSLEDVFLDIAEAEQ